MFGSIEDYEMKIKRIEFKHFLGIEEFELEPGKINIISGPKGSSKSSVIEGIEKVFTNKNRRTEIIKHGADEAILFIETDDGLEIGRKIRNDKADYLKIRKGDEGVPNTEAYLRNFINGDVFRPVDWVNMKSDLQTKSILNMLQIDWSQEKIEKWFGEIPSNIEYDQHILMVLKAIEVKYFKDREELNRQIKELRTQIQIIKKDMPENYDGETWRDLKVQDLYRIISDAQKTNGYIKQAQSLQENIQNQIDTITANIESEATRVQMKYKDQRQDIKDIIDSSKTKIEKTKNLLSEADSNLKNSLSLNETVYHRLLRELEKEFEKKKQDLKLVSMAEDEKMLSNTTKFKEDQKDTIQLQETKIATKQQEFIYLDEIENQALEAVKVKKAAEIEKVNARVGKAAEYLKITESIEIESLQKQADEVATMQSYLRLWDKLVDIRDNQLPERERNAEGLSSKIETARTLPTELLKTAQMPVEGISVDEKGSIRINKTLIEGLSDGEKLTLAMKIAKAQAGELRVVCIDKWESLNKKAQDKLLKEMGNDEFQYFITQVSDTDSDGLEIKKNV
jgi:hypothetical protein